MSAASLASSVATRKPRLGSLLTKPSCSNMCKVSRTDDLLAPVCSHSIFSVSRMPGGHSPESIFWRTKLAMVERFDEIFGTTSLTQAAPQQRIDERPVYYHRLSDKLSDID